MIKEFKKDNLLVKVYESRAAMGEAAADMLIKKINELLDSQDSINMIFAAAPSQNEFLAALRLAPIDWSRVNAFHMDEYVGLSDDAPQRFGNFLKEALFDKVSFKSVNYLNGNNTDLKGECQRYSDLLRKYPTDIVCMGIGENGHLAFNDPPVADFNDTELVKPVELDQTCRQQQVNDGCFNSLNVVPTHALTLTIPTLMAGKFIYCVVPGKTKAEAVYNTINQDIIEQYPSTILRKHPNAILFIDELSSSMLN